MDAERRAAQDRVIAYHNECLALLVEHVGQVIDLYRAGDLVAAEADAAMHQYHRAARELWKFCWASTSGDQMKLVARLIDDQVESVDWWQRGAPRDVRRDPAAG